MINTRSSLSLIQCIIASTFIVPLYLNSCGGTCAHNPTCASFSSVTGISAGIICVVVNHNDLKVKLVTLLKIITCSLYFFTVIHRKAILYTLESDLVNIIFS